MSRRKHPQSTFKTQEAERQPTKPEHLIKMFASSQTLCALVALIVAISAAPTTTSTTTASPLPTIDSLLVIDTFSVISELVSEQTHRLQAYTGYPADSFNFTLALPTKFVIDVADAVFNEQIAASDINDLVDASKGSVQPWVQLNQTLVAKVCSAGPHRVADSYKAPN